MTDFCSLLMLFLSTVAETDIITVAASLHHQYIIEDQMIFRSFFQKSFSDFIKWIIHLTIRIFLDLFSHVTPSRLHRSKRLELVALTHRLGMKETS